MRTPVSTYRIQLYSEFTFKDLKQILPYLHQLGITTLYTSPFMEAVPGSTHCYDAISAQQLNPEIGTESELLEISQWLHNHQMTWLQDIVPNHMSLRSRNEWLMDVLEKGRASEFYSFFDIIWEHPAYAGKLMMPLLDKPLDQLIQEGNLQLQLEKTGIWFQVYTHSLPLSVEQYPYFMDKLRQMLPDAFLQTAYDQLDQAMQQWLSQTAAGSLNCDSWRQFTQSLYDFVQSQPSLKQAFERYLASLSTDLAQLTELVNKQNFCLVQWQETDKSINYRRFFTINELICLRMELQPVFERYHRYINELIQRDVIQHLRIDHIDGLLDPKVYLQRLHQLTGADRYLVVEKILEPNELLPVDWPTDGTTGYDFLSLVNRLLISDQSTEMLSDIYKQMHVQAYEYEEAVFRKKLFMLIHHMGGELDNLTDLLLPLLPAEAEPSGNRSNFRQVLAYWLVSFPVYRLYIDEDHLSDENAKSLAKVFEQAVSRAEDLKDFFQTSHVILAPSPDTVTPEILRFLRRTQQFTGPLMAKGVEDTTFYVYNRLISRNEVGDTPHENENISTTLFHQQMQSRSLTTMNVTATHDTKRGEDVRMRINVLSELANEWKTHLEQWQAITATYPAQPDANDVYFIYQTLVGTYPVHIAPEDENYHQRLQEYIQKVLREAKVHTNWASPESSYEEKVSQFINALLQDPAFLQSFLPFVEKVALYGAVYSWIQTLIRLTAPGIPDTYQGTELWDLSMVDPDNRRPVNYHQRLQLLNEWLPALADAERLQQALTNRLNPGLKLFFMHKLLQMRRTHASLFVEGTYKPVLTQGRYARQVTAYMREWNGQRALVVFPLEIVRLSSVEQLPIGQLWSDTYLQWPNEYAGQYQNVFTGELLSLNTQPSIAQLLQSLPLGCWIYQS